MKIALIITVSILIISSVAYYIFFPKNTFIMVPLKNKSGLTFSKSGVSFNPAPDYYPENGFNHISSYISELIRYSDNFKSLIISVRDGDKALGLNSKSGIISVGFSVQWKQYPEKEKLIRDYFHKLAISPYRDYFANNEETRVLDYHIEGDENELAALVKDILKKLCDISEDDPLDFYYEGT